MAKFLIVSLKQTKYNCVSEGSSYKNLNADLVGGSPMFLFKNDVGIL